MKALRIAALALTITVLTWSARGHEAMASTHYIVKGTLAYCDNGGTACSLYKGNFWKSFVDVEGSANGAHSGIPASLQVGCWHAYAKGSDRVLDRAVYINSHVTTDPGTAAIVGTATDDNTANIVRVGLDFNRDLGTHVTEFQVSSDPNTKINNGNGEESAEHLVSGGFHVIAKGYYLENYDYSNHVFHKAKWLTGTLLCHSGSQAHVAGPEGKAYDWDAEVE